jgi:hypothetical protein
MATNWEEWEKLSPIEQFEAWKKWNPYTGEGLEQFLPEILGDFRVQHLSMAVVGWGSVHGELQLVVDSGPQACPQSNLGVPFAGSLALEHSKCPIISG